MQVGTGVQFTPRLQAILFVSSTLQFSKCEWVEAFDHLKYDCMIDTTLQVVQLDHGIPNQRFLVGCMGNL